jgi:hypothetical protein
MKVKLNAMKDVSESGRTSVLSKDAAMTCTPRFQDAIEAKTTKELLGEL